MVADGGGAGHGVSRRERLRKREHLTYPPTLSSRVDAIARREAEDDLSGSHIHVWILSADENRDAWISYHWSGAEAAFEIPRHDAHALKLGLMSVEAAAIALLPVRHVIASFVWGLLLFGSRTLRVHSNGLETASILLESRRQSYLRKPPCAPSSSSRGTPPQHDGQRVAH